MIATVNASDRERARASFLFGNACGRSRVIRFRSPTPAEIGSVRVLTLSIVLNQVGFCVIRIHSLCEELSGGDVCMTFPEELFGAPAEYGSRAVGLMYVKALACHT
ncbi:MAG: hypothetical protein LBJ65_18385 [Burkholderia sp.]|jgi:hypothetical protein|uniref:hypothetical protein n=1 Tax=Burkholderia sp. TaxID=36773 RepID=UPI00281C2380|nr:hypothetical protein [Burkholderia sp.]MDR0243567.1 hypothetical protein [Burkholderia sp.]